MNITGAQRNLKKLKDTCRNSKKLVETHKNLQKHMIYSNET